MKHHFLKFVTSIILVISGSIVSCLEITGLSVPKLYDEGSKILDRPGGRTLNLIPAKHDPAILAYPDGTIHFKEENSEKVLWSLPTGKSLYSSYREGHGKFDYVDCGDNGELYWHTKHGGKMGVPVTIEQFISSTPHISEDGGVLLGSKESTVFVVDAKSGRLICTYGLSNSPIKMQSDKEKSILYDGNFGKLVEPGDMDQTNVERPMFVTRTDYSLNFFAPNSSKVLWKMTNAQIGAAFPCSQLGLVSQLDMPLPCQSEVAVHQYLKPSVLPESVLSQTITPQLTDDKHLDSDRDNELLPASTLEKNSS